MCFKHNEVSVECVLPLNNEIPQKSLMLTVKGIRY